MDGLDPEPAPACTFFALPLRHLRDRSLIEKRQPGRGILDTLPSQEHGAAIPCHQAHVRVRGPPGLVAPEKSRRKQSSSQEVRYG